MQPHKDILVTISLEKAEEALKVAENSVKDDNLYSAQNRVYYAIFYAVMALGYSNGFTASKHTELLGWFNRKMIHEDKVFPDEMSKIFKNAYENRRRSDYEITYKPNKEDLLDTLQEARSFIDIIKAHINN